jgi:toxin ParE1/3/4
VFLVAYSPAAGDDLEAIVDYIARDKPNAAREWLKKVRSTCQMLAENPDVGEVRAGLGVAGCRSYSIGRYVVFFRRHHQGIEVARIVDGSRDL